MRELSDDIFRWIRENAKADPTKLRLKHHGNREMEMAITQIECRRKAATKLADTLRCDRFIFPNSLAAEQSTSDALADFHASLIEPGSRVLDMTGGLGIDAFHCSRNAKEITAIDINPDVAEALAYNARQLGITNLHAVCADSVEWIAGTSERFDTVFIDPARRGSSGERLFALSECKPDVVALMPRLAEITNKVIIKASPMLDVSRTIEELRCVESIYLIGTATECKELTAVVNFSLPDNNQPTIHAVTIGQPTLSFTPEEEAATKVDPIMPEKGMVLYEPFPSVLKSGAFSVFASRYGVAPIHPHTHLYISDRASDNIPARGYRIVDVVPFSKQGIRQLGDIRQANVSVRNFIISAPELAKKLKIRNGGDTHIFGVKTADGNYMLLISEKLEL